MSDVSYKKLEVGGYPKLVCFKCGERHGRKMPDRTSPLATAACDVCGKHTVVTASCVFGGIRGAWKLKKEEKQLASIGLIASLTEMVGRLFG